MSERTQVWSCGGGVQSAAIAGLIVEGKLPKPDIAVMVDTEREKSSTWAYMGDVIIPALRAVGIEMVIVPKSRFATVDLYAGGGDLLLPVFTNVKGQVSKMPTFCSSKWKRRVCQRYLRSVGVEQCDVWLGMSLEEFTRIKDSAEKWYRHRYPLVYEIPMRRHNCVEYVQSLGWPTPEGSSCYLCPNHSDNEWRHMRIHAPADFQRAVTEEREILKRDSHAFLHRQCVPLDQVDFDSQGDLFSDPTGGCQSGYCFT